jgi:hypothetical protein
MENFILRAVHASLYENYIRGLFFNLIFIILNIEKVNWI